MANPPVLDLNTLIVRPTIRVDGQAYELFSIDELSILDSQRLTLWGKEIEMLAKSDDEAGAERLAALVAKVARKAIADMPDEVFGKLTEGHHASIAQVFTGLLVAQKMASAGALARGMLNQSIGAKSSHGSSGSTAARPTGGSKKRQRRS